MAESGDAILDSMRNQQQAISQRNTRSKTLDIANDHARENQSFVAVEAYPGEKIKVTRRAEVDPLKKANDHAGRNEDYVAPQRAPPKIRARGGRVLNNGTAVKSTNMTEMNMHQNYVEQRSRRVEELVKARAHELARQTKK